MLPESVLAKRFFALSRLEKVAMVVALLWVVGQCVVLALWWNELPTWDARHFYLPNSLDAFQAGEIYPSARNINDLYIQSAGYTNLLVLIRMLFCGDWHPVLVLNLLLNVGILIDVHFIGRRCFGYHTASIAVIIFCLMPVNLFAPRLVWTEIPFLFLALTGFALVVRGRKWMLVLAGLLFFAAHTLRSIEMAFLLPAVFLLALKRSHVSRYAALLVPYVLLLVSFGMLVKSQTGTFLTSASTGGYDLMMAVRNDTWPYQDRTVFTLGHPGYIAGADTMHFAVKDSIWRTRAIEWIKQNPRIYAVQYCRRLVEMNRKDSWSIPPLSAYDDINLVNQMPNQYKAHVILYARQLGYSLLFYLCLVLLPVAVWRYRRDLVSTKGVVLLVFLFGMVGTCLIPTETRYHYEWVWVTILLTSYLLAHINLKTRGKLE